MKYLLMICIFCACDSMPALETERLQMEQSMNEKVNDVCRQLHRDCDSTVLQKARRQADSILLARNKTKRR
jgi:hypothetical protein